MNIMRLLIVLTAIFFWYGSVLAADINWNNIGSHNVTLFYPGVASWEFLNSEDHSLGSKNIQTGKKECSSCHLSKKGELDIQGNEIAAGKLTMKKIQKPFEPDPLPAKKGFLDLNLHAAYDEEHIYIRLQWPSSGASWNNPTLSKDGLVDRVAIQLNHANYDKGYRNKYGCFVTCHNDLNTMPESPSKDKVKSHPYYGALKRDDVRLYAHYTRNGGWADIKETDDLKTISKDNALIDLWKVEFNGKTAAAEDEWILEDRRKDEKGDIKTEGSWDNGKYTVVIKRKLSTDDPRDVQLKEGDTIIFGVAVHDEKTNKRKHYVNLPLSIGLGVEGNIKAEKVK